MMLLTCLHLALLVTYLCDHLRSQFHAQCAALLASQIQISHLIIDDSSLGVQICLTRYFAAMPVRVRRSRSACAKLLMNIPPSSPIASFRSADRLINRHPLIDQRGTKSRTFAGLAHRFRSVLFGFCTCFIASTRFLVASARDISVSHSVPLTVGLNAAQASSQTVPSRAMPHDQALRRIETAVSSARARHV